MGGVDDLEILGVDGGLFGVQVAGAKVQWLWTVVLLDAWMHGRWHRGRDIYMVDALES